jgi:transposase-like protein
MLLSTASQYAHSLAWCCAYAASVLTQQNLLRCYRREESTMSTLMDEEIKRWTAKRKTALVLEIIQGKTSVSEASRTYDLPPSEIESWMEDGRRGMENALKANPQDVREQYERQLKELQEAYGEAMLELRARKKLQSLLGEDEK